MAGTIESLPSEILIRIFEYLRDGQVDFPRYYHESPGLQVEDAAISKSLYHYAQATMNRIMCFYITDYSEDDMEEIDTVVMSNIKQLARDSNTETPREFIFTFGSFPSPAKIQESLEKEGFFSRKWESVRKIYLYKDTAEDFREEQYDSDSLAALSNALAEALPNVVSLRYDVEGEWPYGRTFISDFLVAKADKLKAVDLSRTTLREFGIKQFGQSLTSLAINFDGNDDADFKSLVYAPSLVNLRLISVHPRTVWDLFYSGDCVDDGHLVFSNLESLTIYFDPRAEAPFKPETRDASKISFPKLACLSVYRHDCNANESLEIFPISRIRELHIHDNALHSHFDISRMSSLDALQMDFGNWCNFYECDNIPTWTHPLLSANSKINHLRLDGFDWRFAPGSMIDRDNITYLTVPDTVSLSHLVSLHLNAVLQRGDLPRLLSQLPRLVALEILINSAGPVNLLEPGFAPDSVPKEYTPISKSITYLKSLFAYAMESDDNLDLEHAWFMARLPSLVSWSHNTSGNPEMKALLEGIVADDMFAPHVKHLPPIIELME